MIEKLIRSAYVERKGKQLRSTEQGRNLINVVALRLKDVALTAEEKKNLLAAGAREIWVEQHTLDALIAESRGQYDTVAIRGTVAVRETPKTL